MLLNEKALKERIYSLYRAMKTRAKKDIGRGRLRVPGISNLPFSKEQLWAHALNQVGETGIPCPACMDIGRRRFKMIDLTNLVFDHHVPLSRCGAWNLDNLQAVCEDCNRCKGVLTYEGFIAVMQFIEALPDAKDRSSLYSCLRSHGVSGRMRGFFSKPKSLPANVVADVNQLDF